MREIEYPPLLPDGFKEIAEADLHEAFVAPFHSEAQNCRVNLLIGFGNFLSEFKALHVSAEIWIDGSFTTQAPDPADIDLVFYFDPTEIDNLSEDRKTRFQRLFTNRKFIRNNYQVEVFYAIKSNEADYQQWQKTFGTCYDNKTPKGIFRLTYAR